MSFADKFARFEGYDMYRIECESESLENSFIFVSVMLNNRKK